MTFEFSIVSKTNLGTSVEYLQRHFLNHPAWFFLEQTADRYIDSLSLVLRYPVQFTGLELLPEPLQNKICYRLHPKYSPFSCFPIICSYAIWKSLFLQNMCYLRHFWYLEGSWLNVIPSFCRQVLLRTDYSLVHFMKV